MMGLFDRLMAKGKIYTTKVVVNIVKKRGDAIIVDKVKGEIAELEEGKTRVLRVHGYDELPVDMHRFKLDAKGNLETTVVESKDGSLKFAEIKDSTITEQDDAAWRRSLESSKAWADTLFSRSKTFFEEYGGLIFTVVILFVGVIGMLMLYGKMGQINKQMTTQLAEIAKANSETTKEISRMMSTLTQQMTQISQNLAEASKNLKDVVIARGG